MRKQFVLCFATAIILAIPNSFAQANSQSQALKEAIQTLSKARKIGKITSPSNLPMPYRFLLTQPLMTQGIETYYQRKAIVKTIYAEKNEATNSYFRMILMLIDHNKARNNPEIAQEKKEFEVVELALITMNFNTLPKEVTQDVLSSNIPFGKSLLNHHISTKSANRNYFSLPCDQALAVLTHCTSGKKLYGRTNSLMLKDNQWIAHVVELLL
ncbi:hypothetical protein [Legionella jordanis]|uniref:Uncharacterized protein n=1 Tax=Legionella jordanis TaxID=456 RepID=A0A0W0VAW5_9GAMM|nr:hypothetical protein [Legionella jordanis]KTD17267.1 hypothetical protein Ljor_1573 [Legionella jordanis]RMX03377.1 hypothetical protein EAW55_08165 [Legionella jordanis]RMX15855.1 hypothetical protein EAS68_11520 [Legionella jordanis]VEH12536.1 Uncharacterised protein [Legionella jordanis]HAT8713388.1 hypothetical protein [Legionella jordanis]